MLHEIYKFIQAMETPLFAACEEGHTETAQLLIDKGSNVNQQSRVCYTYIKQLKGRMND